MKSRLQHSKKRVSRSVVHKQKIPREFDPDRSTMTVGVGSIGLCLSVVSRRIKAWCNLQLIKLKFAKGTPLEYNNVDRLSGLLSSKHSQPPQLTSYRQAAQPRGRKPKLKKKTRCTRRKERCATKKNRMQHSKNRISWPIWAHGSRLVTVSSWFDLKSCELDL